MDNQKALLQALWRKAGRAEEPLRVECKSESEARRLRFALYNAVRDARAGKVEADAALTEALENCTVGFAPEDKRVLVLQQKVMTGMMQSVAALVGDAPGLLKSEDEMLVEASQARLAAKLAEFDSASPRPASNPYYTRERTLP